MTTIYDAAILLVDDNPDLLTLGSSRSASSTTAIYCLRDR